MTEDPGDPALDRLVARAADTPVDADRLAARVRNRIAAEASARPQGLTEWLWALPRPVAASFAAVLLATPVAVAVAPLGAVDPLAASVFLLAAGAPGPLGFAP